MGGKQSSDKGSGNVVTSGASFHATRTKSVRKTKVVDKNAKIILMGSLRCGRAAPTEIARPGASEAGKSTLSKVMTLIYGTGFSEDELLSFKATILENVLQAVQAVLDATGQQPCSCLLPPTPPQRR